MIRALILTIGLCGVMVLTAGAADDSKGKRPTKEQKAAMKELRVKYDKDGDGKLSREERDAISADDKTKLKELRAARKKAKGK